MSAVLQKGKIYGYGAEPTPHTVFPPPLGLGVIPEREAKREEVRKDKAERLISMRAFLKTAIGEIDGEIKRVTPRGSRTRR